MDMLDNPDNENMIVEDFCGDSDARPYSFSYSDTKINTDWNIIWGRDDIAVSFLRAIMNWHGIIKV